MTEPDALDALLAEPDVLDGELADAIAATLAAVPEDPSSTKDLLLRARLEGYVEGLRGHPNRT